MCGILGAIPTINKHIFKKALNNLKHRGPDDEGIWSNGTEIILGHRRLAILDLSAKGHQPMLSTNKRYTITFNGEIYNFLEIKKELEKKGIKFQSNSDTEVILESYKVWGTECVNKFNGMWAFAIWDNSDKKIFLSRDRFGQKPLYYYMKNNKFIFASEMKAIIPFIETVQPHPNFQKMTKNPFSYESTSDCLIKDIYRFPAGSNAIYHHGDLKTWRYWNTLDNLVDVPAKYEDQVELFRDLFIDSCRLRMRSDVPIGTALSGGLDSSIVISTLAEINNNNYEKSRIAKDWQHAFVATFPNTPLDEKSYAQAVTKNLGINGTYIPINPLDAIDEIDDYIYKCEDIYITSPIPMILTYKSMKQSGISVSIDGHGADELFSGYGNSFFEAFLDAGLNLKKINQIFSVYLSSQLKSQQFKSSKNLPLLYSKFILKRIIKNMIGMHIYKTQDYADKRFQKLDHFNRYLYDITENIVLPTLLRNYDRYSMANGVEIRMPFLDHRLVSYSLSLPWESKIKDGLTKKFLRDTFQNFLPESVVKRKDKMGFNSPMLDWMKGSLKEYFLDHINSTQFKNSTLIDNKKVKEQFINIINNKNSLFSDGINFWLYFNIYLWERIFLNKHML